MALAFSQLCWKLITTWPNMRRISKLCLTLQDYVWAIYWNVNISKRVPAKSTTGGMYTSTDLSAQIQGLSEVWSKKSWYISNCNQNVNKLHFYTFKV